MRARRWLWVGVGAALGFAGLVALALESSEVIVLRTRDAAGAAHETRIWIAEDDRGVSWIEAATPERSWYRQIVARPEVDVVRGGETRSYRAIPVPGPEGHDTVRRLLAARYGVRDRIVALVADTSRSVGIRLEPIPGGASTDAGRTR